MLKNAQMSERHMRILEILRVKAYATVDMLANELYVSQSSVRRDLNYLETRGFLKRSYGVVSLKTSDNLNVPFPIRLNANVTQKRNIAKKALELVDDGDTVFVDASSTCMYLLYELVNKKGITVVTNGVNAVHYLQNFNVKVICTGGSLYRDDPAAMTGADTIDVISHVRANVVFFSPQAIDDSGTLLDCYHEENAVIRCMMKYSDKKVCLCDSTKIGKVSSFKLCDMSEVDVLVCDQPQADRYKADFPNLRFL